MWDLNSLNGPLWDPESLPILYINSLSPSVRPSVWHRRRSDPLTVSAMPRDRFCYVFASFFILFFGFVWGRPGPALIGGRNFLFPVCGQSYWRHSSAERRPGIADVKNGVPGRVRSGLCVTELANFCSREDPLTEVMSSQFRKLFGMVVADFGYCSWFAGVA